MHSQKCWPCGYTNSRSNTFTTQKITFSIKDFFSKCDQIRRKLRIWSHLLKKFLIENFIFCPVVFIHTISFGTTQPILG